MEQQYKVLLFSILLITSATMATLALLPLLQTEVTITEEQPTTEFDRNYIEESELSASEAEQVRQDVEEAPFKTSALFEGKTHNSAVEIDGTVYSFTESEPFIQIGSMRLDSIVGYGAIGMLLLGGILLLSGEIILSRNRDDTSENTMRM